MSCFVDSNIWLYAFHCTPDGLVIDGTLTIRNPFKD